MPHKEETIKGRNTQPLVFLPITAALFTKKGNDIEAEQNPFNFHLDMVNKIDRILADHTQDTTQSASVHGPPIIPLRPPSPIEPRPPLNRTVSHEEITWESTLESSKNPLQTNPEEFRTELSIDPEFRFINSHEFIESFSQMEPSSDRRIEIIDFNELARGSMTIQKTINGTDIEKHSETSTISFLKDEAGQNHLNRKIEIIDARTLKQKTYEEACIAASQQAEQIEKKAQVYFVSKDALDKKQKKLPIEQSYIPDDFEERSKKLKGKQEEEEEEEEDVFEDDEFEDLEPEEEPHEKHHLRKNSSSHTPSFQKSSTPKKTPRQIKKELKEKKRLKRLEIRKARMQERKHQKEQKVALKMKQKQQHLEHKSKDKHRSKKTGSRKNDAYAQSAEYDEDLKRVLRMTDSLLEHLPEHIIDEFVQSENFDIYQRVLNKYKVYERVMNKKGK
jgi:hypothetical protein